jgi:hypothetical protein
MASTLKIEGKTLFYKELFDNNIIFIKDILDEENKFKTYEYVISQFYNILPRAFK